jgi:hypothetical protein
LGVWSALGDGINSTFGNIVRAIVVVGTDVYVGGNFTTVNGLTGSTYRVAKWNGSTWSRFGTAIANGFGSNQVNTLLRVGSDIYIGGQFNRVDMINTTVGKFAWAGAIYRI